MVSRTPAAKRALNFGNTPSKRARMTRAMAVLPRKPEMKYKDFTIVHSAATTSNLVITNIANGAANGERIGAKIDIRFAELTMRSTAQCRLEVLRLNDSTTAPAHTYDQFPDRNLFSTLTHQHVTFAGSPAQADGYYHRIKLPFGNVVKYTTTTGTTANKNEITLYLTAPVPATINGTVRVWYTDV